MSIIYVLPKRRFFKKGYTGSVMHAVGIIEGLNKNKIDVVVLAHDFNYPKTIYNIISAYLVSFKGYLSKYITLWKLIKEKALTEESFKVLVRYSFSEVIFLLFLSSLCRLYKVNSILEVNTLYSFYKRTIFTGFIERIELFFCRGFTTVYVVSPNSVEFFEEKGFTNVIYVPNGIFRYNNNNDSCPKIFFPDTLKYFGSVKHYYNLDFLIDCIQAYPFSLEIYGNVTKDFIDKHADNPKVIIKGKYANDEIYLLVDPRKDVLVLPYKANSIADYGFPTKLGEYLSLGCVILTTDTGVLKTIFNHKMNAVVYSDNDKTSLAEAFNYIGNMTTNDLSRMVKNSKEEVENYQWEKLVKFIFDEKSFTK